MMTIWEQASIVVNAGKELTPDDVQGADGRHDGNHIYGSVPFGCAEAPAPYIAVCSSAGQPPASGTARKLDHARSTTSRASTSSPAPSSSPGP